MLNATETVTIATSEYESIKSRMAELEALVKYYEEQIRLNKHRQFGPSSERDEISGQLGLFDGKRQTRQPFP